MCIKVINIITFLLSGDKFRLEMHNHYCISKMFERVWSKKKISVDQGSEFQDRSMMSQLHDSGIEIYSTYNEGKYPVAETFIRALKKQICKHMTAVSKMCTWISQMIQFTNTLLSRDIKLFQNIFFRQYQNTKIFLHKATHQIGL